MKNLLVPSELTETALAAGFAPDMDECDLAELSFLIHSDKWFMDLVNDNARLEMKAPPPVASGDDIARATMESLSHGEKCALRNRVLGARHWEHVEEANQEFARRARIRARLINRARP